MQLRLLIFRRLGKCVFFAVVFRNTQIIPGKNALKMLTLQKKLKIFQKYPMTQKTIRQYVSGTE